MLLTRWVGHASQAHDIQNLQTLLANRSEHACLGVVKPGSLEVYPINLDRQVLSQAADKYNLSAGTRTKPQHFFRVSRQEHLTWKDGPSRRTMSMRPSINYSQKLLRISPGAYRNPVQCTDWMCCPPPGVRYSFVSLLIVELCCMTN